MRVLYLYLFAFIVLVSAKKCPARINDGFADWPESEEGQVTSECYEGYVSESKPYRKCVNGQWSEISFKCHSQSSSRLLQARYNGFKITGSFSVYDSAKCNVDDNFADYNYTIEYIWGFGRNNLTLYDTESMIIGSCYSATNYTAVFNVNVQTSDINNIYFNVRGRFPGTNLDVIACKSESIYNTFYPVTATNTEGIGECELTYHNKVEGQNPRRKCTNSVWEEADNDACVRYEFPKIEIDFSGLITSYISSGVDNGKIQYSGNIVLKTDTCDQTLLPLMFVYVIFDSKSHDKFVGIEPTNVSYCFTGNQVAIPIHTRIVAYNYYFVSVGVFGTKKMDVSDKLVVDSFNIECKSPDPPEYHIDWDITLKGPGAGKCIEFYRWIGSGSHPMRECLGNNEYTTNDTNNSPDIDIKLDIKWDELYNKIKSGTYEIIYTTCDPKNTYPITYKVIYNFDGVNDIKPIEIPSCINENKQTKFPIIPSKTKQQICETVVTNNITWDRTAAGATRTYADFACKPFFEFDGTSPSISRNCLSNGTWEDSPYICLYEGVKFTVNDSALNIMMKDTAITVKGNVRITDTSNCKGNKGKLYYQYGLCPAKTINASCIFIRGSKDYCFINNIMDIIPGRDLVLKAYEHFLHIRIGTDENDPKDFVYIKRLSCKAFEKNNMIFPLSLLGDVEGKCKPSYEYKEEGFPPKLTCKNDGWIATNSECGYNPPEIKFNFNSVTFDNTNVNTPKAYGTIYIEDKSKFTRLFPPSTVYLYICFMSTKKGDPTTCVSSNNKLPQPISIAYPFDGNVTQYKLDRYINSLDYRILYIVLSDSKNHKYDSKTIKYPYCKGESKNDMTYANSVPGVVNGTCQIFWRPEVDNRRVCKNDGTWETTTNKCIKEKEIFKIDFSQLNIEVLDNDKTSVTGRFLVHDLLECNTPFPPDKIYLIYCYTHDINYCYTGGSNYGYDKVYPSYCFENNTLAIPISRVFTNNQKEFSNYFLVKIFDRDASNSILYTMDHRVLTCRSLNENQAWFTATPTNSTAEGYCAPMHYYVDDSKRPSTECLLNGSFASLDNDEFCFYNGTQFEIDAYIHEPLPYYDNKNRLYYQISGYADIVDNALCNYIYHQNYINITFFFSNNSTLFKRDYSNTDYSTPLAYCFKNKLYFNYTYDFAHYGYDYNYGKLSHHYALIRLSPYENIPLWNFNSSITFQEIVIATYCPYEEINLLEWPNSDVGEVHNASCPNFTEFYGDENDLIRTCEKSGYYNYFNKSKTGCRDLNRTFIIDFNVTGYMDENGYAIINGKITITQTVKVKYQFAPKEVFLYVGFYYHKEIEGKWLHPQHKEVIPYPFENDKFEFNLVNYTADDPEWMTVFYSRFDTTRKDNDIYYDYYPVYCNQTRYHENNLVIRYGPKNETSKGYCYAFYTYSIPGAYPESVCQENGTFIQPNPVTERCDYLGTGFKISVNISVIPTSYYYNYFNLIGYVKIDDTWSCNYTRHHDLISNHYRWSDAEDDMSEFKDGDNFYNISYCFENDTFIYPITIKEVFLLDIHKYQYLNWRIYPTYPEYKLNNRTTFDKISKPILCLEENIDQIRWRISNVSETVEGICEPFYNYTHGYRPYRECQINGKWSSPPPGKCEKMKTHFTLNISMLNLTIDEKELLTLKGILIITDNDDCRYSYTPDHIYYQYGLFVHSDYLLNGYYSIPYCFENGKYFLNITGLFRTESYDNTFKYLNFRFCEDSRCNKVLNRDSVILSCPPKKLKNGYMSPAVVGEYSYGYCDEFYEYDGGNIPKALCLDNGQFEEFNETQKCIYTGTKFVLNRNFSIESINSSYYHLYGDVVIRDDYYCKYTRKPDTLRLAYNFYKENNIITNGCDFEKDEIPYCLPDNNTYTVHYDFYVNKTEVEEGDYNYMNYHLIAPENDKIFKCYQSFADFHKPSFCQRVTSYSISWDYGSLDQYNEGDCPPFTNYNGPTVRPLRYCNLDGTWKEFDNVYKCEPITTGFEISFDYINSSVDEYDSSNVIFGNISFHDRFECNFNFTPFSLFVRYGSSDEKGELGYTETKEIPYCWQDNKYEMEIPTYTSTDYTYHYLTVQLCVDSSCSKILQNRTEKVFCSKDVANEVTWERAGFGTHLGQCPEFYTQPETHLLERQCNIDGNWDSYNNSCILIDLPRTLITLSDVSGYYINNETGEYNITFTFTVAYVTCSILPPDTQIKFSYSLLEKTFNDYVPLKYTNDSYCRNTDPVSFTKTVHVTPSEENKLNLHAKICLATRLDDCSVLSQQVTYPVACKEEENAYNSSWLQSIVNENVTGRCLPDYVYDNDDGLEFPTRKCLVGGIWSAPSKGCTFQIRPEFDWDFTNLDIQLQLSENRKVVKSVTLNGPVYLTDLKKCTKFQPILYFQYSLWQYKDVFLEGETITEEIDYCFKNKNVFTKNFTDFSKANVRFLNCRMCMDENCEKVIQKYTQPLYCEAVNSNGLDWDPSPLKPMTNVCPTISGSSGWTGPEKVPTKICFKNGTWDLTDYRCEVPRKWCTNKDEYHASWPLSVPKPVVYGNCHEGYISVGPDGHPFRECFQGLYFGPDVYYKCVSNSFTYLVFDLTIDSKSVVNKDFDVKGKFNMHLKDYSCLPGDNDVVPLDIYGYYGSSAKKVLLTTFNYTCHSGNVFDNDFVLPVPLLVKYPGNTLELVLEFNKTEFVRHVEILGCEYISEYENNFNTSLPGTIIGQCTDGYVSDNPNNGNNPFRKCNKEGLWEEIEYPCYKQTYKDLVFDYKEFYVRALTDSDKFCISQTVNLVYKKECPTVEKYFELSLYSHFTEDAEKEPYSTTNITFMCQENNKFTISEERCIFINESNYIIFDLYVDGKLEKSEKHVLGCERVKVGKDNWYISLIGMNEGFCDAGGYRANTATGNPMRECTSKGWGMMTSRCVLEEYQYFKLSVNDQFLSISDSKFCMNSVLLKYETNSCNTTLVNYRLTYLLGGEVDEILFSSFEFDCKTTKEYIIKPKTPICVNDTSDNVLFSLSNENDFITDLLTPFGCRSTEFANANFPLSLVGDVVEGECLDGYIIFDSPYPSVECQEDSTYKSIHECLPKDYPEISTDKIEISVKDDKHFCVSEVVEVYFNGEECRKPTLNLQLKVYYIINGVKKFLFNFPYTCKPGLVYEYRISPEICLDENVNNMKWEIDYLDNKISETPFILGCLSYTVDRYKFGLSPGGDGVVLGECLPQYEYVDVSYRPKAKCNKEEGKYEEISGYCTYPDYHDTKFSLDQVYVSKPPENNTFCVEGTLLTVHSGSCDNLSSVIPLTISYKYPNSDEKHFFEEFVYNCNEGIIDLHKFNEPLCVDGTTINNITIILEKSGSNEVISSSSLLLGCVGYEDDSTIWEATLTNNSTEGVCKPSFVYNDRAGARKCNADGKWEEKENVCVKLKEKTFMDQYGALVIGLSAGVCCFWWLMVLVSLFVMYLYKKFRQKKEEKQLKVIIPSDSNMLNNMPPIDTAAQNAQNPQNVPADAKPLEQKVFHAPKRRTTRRKLKPVGAKPNQLPALKIPKLPVTVDDTDIGKDDFHSSRPAPVLNDNGISLRINSKDSDEFNYKRVPSNASSITHRFGDNTNSSNSSIDTTTSNEVKENASPRPAELPEVLTKPISQLTKSGLLPPLARKSFNPVNRFESKTILSNAPKQELRKKKILE